MLATLATTALLSVPGTAAAAGTKVTWTLVPGQRQGDVFIVRAGPRRDTRAPVVLFHHGAGGTAKMLRDAANSAGQRKVIEALARAGYLVAVSDFGGNLFGNDKNQRYITDLIDLARLHGGRRGKVALAGVSMGGGATLAYAGNNPDKVACVVGLIPAIDLNYIRTLLPALVDPPYGGRYEDRKHGPRHSPLVMARRNGSLPLLGGNAGPFSAMPIAIWYATADTVCTPLALAGFAASVNTKANPRLTTHPIASTHSDAGIGSIPASDITTFVRRHLPL